MTISRKEMCNRLQTIGINKHLTHRLVNDVEKWLKRNGPEWTIARLKDAKSYYLSTLAGKKPEMVTWWAMVGPTKHRRFKSPWLNIPHDSEKKLVRALSACNAYSMFIKTGDPTPKQKAKFYDSVIQPNRPSMSSTREITNVFISLLDKTNRERQTACLQMMFPKKNITVIANARPSKHGNRKIPSPSHFSEYIYSDSKNAPVVDNVNRGVEDEMKWVVDNITSPAVMGLLYQYKGLASSVGLKAIMRNKNLKIDYSGNSAGGGNIAYIQEPGFKLRAIGNPFRVHQVVLEPLKKILMEYLRKIPTDCTHDQGEGQIWAQAKLHEGRTVHAVDLSDATNNIPLEPQIVALVTALQLDMHDKTTSDLVSYFVDVSRETWKTPENDLIRWTTGQPMGLGPSFGSFALWHNFTLRLAHSVANSQFSSDDSFRVVGDDVVIACDKTYKLYREALKALDIPVSESKCISSSKCTEFVGKVITANNSYAIPKWKALSDRNFMDVLKFLGPKALSWCKPRQRIVAKILAPLPEIYGGFGWNPKGLSYETRSLLAYEYGLLDDSPETEPVRDLTRAMITNVNKVCHHGDVSLWSDFLDRKFTHHLNSTEFKFTKELENLPVSDRLAVIKLEGLSVDSDVNPLIQVISSMAPGPVLSTGDPRDTTTLERLESALKDVIKEESSVRSSFNDKIQTAVSEYDDNQNETTVRTILTIKIKP